MSGGATLLAFLGVVLPAAVALLVGLRSSKSTDKSGMAGQFTALTVRLENVENRLTATEGREATLRGKFNSAVDFIARQGRFIDEVTDVMARQGRLMEELVTRLRRAQVDPGDLTDRLDEVRSDMTGLHPPIKPKDLEED